MRTVSSRKFIDSRTSLALAMVLFVGVPTVPAWAQVTYNTIALSGATGTGWGLGPNLGAGVNFDSFSAPVINAAGEVAFFGSLDGAGVGSTNDNGVFVYDGGTLAAIARKGSDGPGPNLGAGVNFSSFPGTLVLNAAGDVAFRGVLTGTGVVGTNNNGIFSNTGGALNAVARSGSTGPGPNLGPNIDFIGFGSPVFNSAGEVAFLSNLIGTGVDGTNDMLRAEVWSHKRAFFG